jgi:hypothetical protein
LEPNGLGRHVYTTDVLGLLVLHTQWRDLRAISRNNQSFERDNLSDYRDWWQRIRDYQRCRTRLVVFDGHAV